MSQIDAFYDLSVALTDYHGITLRGTGVGETYYEVVTTIVGQAIVDDLLKTYQLIHSESQKSKHPEAAKERLIRNEILSNERLGPVARNVIKMWYLSIWYQLPIDWRQKYGNPSQASHQKYTDVDFVVSRDTYIQGLIWPTVGSHPMYHHTC